MKLPEANHRPVQVDSVDRGQRIRNYLVKGGQTSAIRISIITVTYNSAATLKDTLESVKNQDYKNFEHIIVDGHSSDGTTEIIKSYPHVERWISERDSCLYEAMNKGILLSTGDVIGILNSDDIYAHNKVLSDVAACFCEKNADAIYSDLQYVRPNNIEKVVRNWKSGDFKRSNFYYGWMPPHPTFFVQRYVYDEVGLFNLSLKTSADYEMMLRILFKYCFNAAYLPGVTVKMRSGGISNRTVINRLLANREDRQAWKINGLKPYFFTLSLKPLRKVFQFIV